MEKIKYELEIIFSTKFNVLKEIGVGGCFLARPAIQVMVIGEQGDKSRWTKLDKKNGFYRNHIIHADDLGEPILICIKLSGCCLSFGHAMYCDEIIVKYKYKTFKFPVADWIYTKEVVVARGGGILPQKEENQHIKAARIAEREAANCLFKWADKPLSDKEQGWGINRYLEGSLANFKFPWLFLMSTKRFVDFISGNALGKVNQTCWDTCGGLPVLEDLDDYKKLYETFGYGDPYFIADWDKDFEMGRQVLTGIAPQSLYQCKEIPDGCNINNNVVCPLLEEGKTLESEMEAGKIYMGDFSSLKGLKRNTSAKGDSLYCANAFGLFYATENEFLPLAIQLEPNEKDSVFTKKDTEDDWTLAKMYFRCAMSNKHQWVYHYLLTHGLSETFAVATFRNFPRSHPIYKLLRPHLITVASINTAARLALLPEGTGANNALSISALAVVRDAYKTFKYSDLDIPNVIKARGLDCVPNNPYCDDTMEIWNALTNYVDKVVHYFYSIDQDVVDDFEVQDWVRDLALQGIGWQDGNTRGFPEELETIEQLVKMCTVIIYTSSAQHAAVNFGQFDIYRFVPNSPGAMAKPPHKRGQGSRKRIMESLPNLNSSNAMMSLAYALSTFSRDEVFLSDFVDKLFIDLDVLEMQSHFKTELSRLTFKFMRRNLKLKYPYTYLLPNEIPISIAI